MLARAERIEGIMVVRQTAPLIPLIESAASFEALRAFAAVAGVQRVAFGAIGLPLDMKCAAIARRCYSCARRSC